MKTSDENVKHELDVSNEAELPNYLKSVDVVRYNNTSIVDLIIDGVVKDLKKHKIVEVVYWTELSDGEYCWMSHPCTIDEDTIREVVSDIELEEHKPTDTTDNKTICLFSFVAESYVTVNPVDIMYWVTNSDYHDYYVNYMKKLNSIVHDKTTALQRREIEMCLFTREMLFDIVEPGTLVELLNIFEYNISIPALICMGEDVDDVTLQSAKENWWQLIQQHKDKAHKILDDEMIAAEKENDELAIEEIQIVKGMIDEIDREYLDNFKSIVELTSYWPPLLLPAPTHALGLSNMLERLSVGEYHLKHSLGKDEPEGTERIITGVEDVEFDSELIIEIPQNTTTLTNYNTGSHVK